jgi:predicted anti-sigma-YlaC factor YlaD
MRRKEAHLEHRIEALLDGETVAPESQRIREHLERCSRCARHLEQSMGVRSLLQREAWQAPLPSVWPVLSERLARDRSPKRRFATAIAVAGSLLVGVSLGLYVAARPAPRSPGETDLWTTLGSTVAQESNGLHEVYLNDVDTQGAPRR